jgi:hypothetical protein
MKCIVESSCISNKRAEIKEEKSLATIRMYNRAYFRRISVRERQSAVGGLGTDRVPEYPSAYYGSHITES